MLAEAAMIVSAIKAANDAFGAIREAKGNATSMLSGAAKFLEAKQKVDVQAAEDKAQGNTSTQAFVASIELTRRQKELDDFFTYECEGWVGAEWNKHKAALRKQAKDEVFAARQSGKAKRKAQAEDNDMDLAIKVFTVLCAVVISIVAGAVIFGVV